MEHYSRPPFALDQYRCSEMEGCREERRLLSSCWTSFGFERDGEKMPADSVSSTVYFFLWGSSGGQGDLSLTTLISNLLNHHTVGMSDSHCFPFISVSNQLTIQKLLNRLNNSLPLHLWQKSGYLVDVLKETDRSWQLFAKHFFLIPETTERPFPQYDYCFSCRFYFPITQSANIVCSGVWQPTLKVYTPWYTWSAIKYTWFVIKAALWSYVYVCIQCFSTKSIVCVLWGLTNVLNAFPFSWNICKAI